MEYLREFLVVAALRNFSAAARQLYISQSSLSRHILLLEEELGVRLLTRSKHTVDLTPMGVEAYECFHDMFIGYDHFLGRVSKANEGLTATLRIGTFPIVVDEYIYPWVKAFRDQYPGVLLEYTSAMPVELKAHLFDDELDTALMVTTDFVGAEQLRFRKSGQERYIAMLDVHHPLASHSSLRLSDLSEECILIHQDEEYARCALYAMAACGFIPLHTAVMPSIETVQFSLLETKGVFIAPESLGKLSFTSVRCIPFEEPEMAINVYFAYKKDNPNPAVPLLMKLCPTE
ncbi:MAG: LysR family transcriptional regulator [Coriobacteriales bacterium]|jgi:DNA-binding transcriptional LysR family regulator|nr:LysR family transcriptional regulator [Coriobacteriales bacterium]